jgi:hypothetical protein
MLMNGKEVPHCISRQRRASGVEDFFLCVCLAPTPRQRRLGFFIFFWRLAPTLRQRHIGFVFVCVSRANAAPAAFRILGFLCLASVSKFFLNTAGVAFWNQKQRKKPNKRL